MILHSKYISVLVMFLNIVYQDRDILEVVSSRAIYQGTVGVQLSIVSLPGELYVPISWVAAYKAVVKEGAIERSS